MISSFYGHKINLLPLRHHTNLCDQGVELLRLMDIANEKKVNQSLRELDITKIIIAHSAETINMVDRVINLDGHSH
ncbi:hypothetical protein VHTUMSATKI_47140 [Vibrio harveyi]|uniref:hypothetical protein n=1 Tax=Vibrio harveyi TaxID=669 RepID=UPI0036F244B3